MPLRILIADGEPSFRDMVRRFLGEAVTVVGEAEIGEDAVRLAAEMEPDVVLMGIGIPGVDAIEATHQIKEQRSTTKVILLTGHDEEAYLSATGKTGADDFLPKRAVRSELLTAIRDVMSDLPQPRRAARNERRLRRTRSGEVPGWDGRERRRRYPWPDGTGGDKDTGQGGGQSAA